MRLLEHGTGGMAFPRIRFHGVARTISFAVTAPTPRNCRLVVSRVLMGGYLVLFIVRQPDNMRACRFRTAYMLWGTVLIFEPCSSTADSNGLRMETESSIGCQSQSASDGPKSGRNHFDFQIAHVPGLLNMRKEEGGSFVSWTAK
jgi:hypothetical protein